MTLISSSHSVYARNGHPRHNSYFGLIRSQNLKKNYFYCCNRVSKKLPDGTVVSFDDYPWLETDKVVFDEVCDWYSEFPISRPPFVKKFDGKHKHRLIEIKVISEFASPFHNALIYSDCVPAHYKRGNG